MNIRLTIVAVSAFSFLAFSVGADAKKCANGKGYRYVNGEQVCPEDYTDSERLQMKQQEQQQQLDRIQQKQRSLEADIQQQEHDLKWRELLNK